MSKDLIRSFLLIFAIYGGIYAANLDYAWGERLISAVICGVCSAYFVILGKENKK